MTRQPHRAIGRSNTPDHSSPVLTEPLEPRQFLTGGIAGLAAPSADITGRHVFYNHSSFDGNDGDTNAADDNAIAADKSALRPGGVASFANVTSFNKGINGVNLVVDGGWILQ